MNPYGIFVAFVLLVVALMAADVVRQAIANRRAPRSRWGR